MRNVVNFCTTSDFYKLEQKQAAGTSWRLEHGHQSPGSLTSDITPARPGLTRTGREKPAFGAGERGHRTRDSSEPWFMKLSL